MNIFGGTSKSKLSETHFIEAGLINMLIKITQVQNHLDFSFCLVNGLFHISGLAIVSCMKLFLFNLQSWIFQIISYCLFLSILFKFNDDFRPWRWFVCACKFFLYSLLTLGNSWICCSCLSYGSSSIVSSHQNVKCSQNCGIWQTMNFLADMWHYLTPPLPVPTPFLRQGLGHGTLLFQPFPSNTTDEIQFSKFQNQRRESLE